MAGLRIELTVKAEAEVIKAAPQPQAEPAVEDPSCGEDE